MSYSLDAGGLTADDLGAMTVAQIRDEAAQRGYRITKTKKAEIIEEFLQ